MKTAGKEKMSAEGAAPAKVLDGGQGSASLRGSENSSGYRTTGGKSPNRTLIAGLGNPGAVYENTYHNVGVQALEHLSKKNLSDTKKMKPYAGLFECTTTRGIVWIQPLVFMNESGKAIAEALHFFKIQPKNMIILHDDSDLCFGDFKISFGSGSAGHKGVESIIKQLGTKDFFRVRIGIRPPEENQKRRRKASELVLGNITPENKKQFLLVFQDIKSTLERKGIIDAGEM